MHNQTGRSVCFCSRNSSDSERPLLCFTFISGVTCSQSRRVFRETSRYILLYNLLFADTVQLAQAQLLYLLAVSRILLMYSACVVLTLLTDLTNDISPLTLVVMSLERYIAVCYPLRHTTVVTVRNTGVAVTVVWAFSSLNILIRVLLLLDFISRTIAGPFCDNASLFKLSCDNILINNIYGLSYTAVLLGLSAGGVIFTYLRITMVCLSSKNKVLNSRALQTCTTHLAVYIIMYFSCILFIIFHRFPDLSEQRKLASIVFHVVPPALNTVIYGLQIKTVRQKVFFMFTRNTMKMIE
uniref:G-protein coupled receptors family 1 profile domain-containing protein n=1 Tax=Monopterus albus TaxID=43700 RepID=A0A3Q3KBU6_MONAL